MAWIELHQTLREHKKMFACADDLNISRIQMIGVLVSIWLWALDNAQDGSLEGVSDKTIARVCDFPEKKAVKLMAALHNNGWLDKCDDHYSIHDWKDYAGKLMERREKDRERKKSSKAVRKNSNGIPTEHERNSCATVPIPYRTVPNHMLEGENTEDITGTAGNPPRSDGSLFTAFWYAYPETAKRKRADAWNAWTQLNPTAEQAESIMEHLDAWKKSQRWLDDNGAYIPNAENFLDPDRGYMRNKPLPAKKKECDWTPGQRPLGAEEIEAIHRLLNKPLPEIDWLEESEVEIVGN